MSSDSDIKYPHIKVKLTGGDGNAFALLGKMRRDLRRGGVQPDEIARCVGEAMKWAEVS